MLLINSLLSLIYREYKINSHNFYDILSIILFFFLGILIFVFSVGPEQEIFNKINIGIVWTLLLFSNNLTINKFYQNDFEDNSITLIHMSGLSFEIIVVIKLLTMWIFFQLPFILIIPISGVLLNIDFNNINLIVLTFLIGSPILTTITSISASMNLLNKKNFTLGSLIIMIFSIPVIIFSVGIFDVNQEMAKAQINILLGILFLFIAITPWISAACIKLAIQNK